MGVIVSTRYGYTRDDGIVGNGRTARLWTLWIGLRYRLPPFIVVKPRPAGQLSADAAAASMRGDHRLCIRVFEQMLRSKLGQP